MTAKILNSPVAQAPATDAKPRLGYLPGLDGLRALAVLAVLVYHADLLWLPGGFLGVEVFFVVSGYLITSLLLAEYRQQQKINLKQFWQRRARRLLPALYALIIAVLAYAVIFLPDEVTSLRTDALSAFTYVTNWYLIVAQKSYFESMGRPSLLQHLWSLAVEEQFYLVWPLLFTVLLSQVKTRTALLLLMFGATLSALWMGFQYQPDTDPSRVYYGTDTRAAGILIGAALAFVWMPRTGDASRKTRWRWLLDAVGFGALVGLLAAGLFINEFDPFLYQGGMLLVAAATALVIAAIVHPQSPVLAPLLSIGILRWIGLRSYSLYLWHWPVFMLTRPQLDVLIDGWELLAVRFGLTFLLAEISYRIIETPIRQGGIGKTWNAWTQLRGVQRWAAGALGAGVLAAMVFGGFVLGNALINAQPAPQPDYLLLNEQDQPTALDVSASSDATPPSNPEETVAVTENATSSDLSPVSFIVRDDTLPATTEPPSSFSPDGWLPALLAKTELGAVGLGEESQRFAQESASRAKTLCNPVCSAKQDYGQTSESFVRATVVSPPQPPRPVQSAKVPLIPPHNGPVEVFAIGDSVMLGASSFLHKTIGAVDVDAKLGRQVSAALQILQARKNANLLPPTVIVHLGNNGIFSARQFDQMMTLLSDVPHVIFLTNKVPRQWQTPNNNALEEGVKRYPNATLVDWYAFSAQHPEWFWNDGIHLRPEGAQIYANLIASTIAQEQTQP